jgi:hypothetical protein
LNNDGLSRGRNVHEPGDKTQHEGGTLLHSDEHSTNQHYHCPEESRPHPPFTEEEPRPENGEDGTELEERRDISDEAKGNRREPEEWGDSCKQDGLLGPQTKFTTLRSQNTALVETTNNAKPDVRTLVLRSARGAVAPAASWVPASRSDATHAD